MSKNIDRLKGKRTPLGIIEFTRRNFRMIRFRDRYDIPCSLQQSSIADYEPPGSSAVWLGVDRQKEQHDGIFDEANQTRMHLDLGQVKALIAVLEMWVQTGDFAE